MEGMSDFGEGEVKTPHEYINDATDKSQFIYYTGVGSQKTPEDIRKKMIDFGTWAVEKGLILRSGGADGADKSFALGAWSARRKMTTSKHVADIYIPWIGFNDLPNGDAGFAYYLPNHASFKIAQDIHPNWSVCSSGVRKLHARNIHQVLGKDLLVKSLFLVCWTDGGMDKGGTRTAIVLARKHGIPIFNLYSDADQKIKEIEAFVDKELYGDLD